MANKSYGLKGEVPEEWDRLDPNHPFTDAKKRQEAAMEPQKDVVAVPQKLEADESGVVGREEALRIIAGMKRTLEDNAMGRAERKAKEADAEAGEWDAKISDLLSDK